jgi:hypothetical protein
MGIVGVEVWSDLEEISIVESGNYSEDFGVFRWV